MKNLVLLIAFAIVLQSCGKKSSSGNGSFPNFYTLTKASVPSQGTSSSIFRSLTSFDTDSSHFSTAFDTSNNYIGQVINDPGPTGPVKSMYVLLQSAQSDIDDINSNFSDASGNSTNCTAISSTTTIKTPFFDTATNGIFNSWTDTGKYNCYTTTASGGIKMWGRVAISSPSAGCTDAYEYYVMTGYGSKDQANSEQVSTRGTTVSSGGIKKFYYNGCSSDLKLAYAQSTKYSLGVEFSSRSEITGNSQAHSFTIRTDYIDADTTYANHITIYGTGVSKVSTSGADPVHFSMGYRSDNCGTSSNSATCTLGTAQNFCVKNAGTTNAYTLQTDSTKCSSIDSTFSAITPLVRSDLPSGYVEVNAAAFGL